MYYEYIYIYMYTMNVYYKYMIYSYIYILYNLGLIWQLLSSSSLSKMFNGRKQIFLFAQWVQFRAEFKSPPQILSLTVNLEKMCLKCHGLCDYTWQKSVAVLKPLYINSYIMPRISVSWNLSFLYPLKSIFFNKNSTGKRSFGE